MVTMKPVWLILFIASVVTLFVGILVDAHMLYLTAKPVRPDSL
jgi:hypothetical protein